jgi:N-acetylglutamate synthase-like GNAT family acetyltransferase
MISPVTTENLDECVYAFLKAYNCPPWNYQWTTEKAKQYLLEYMSCKQFAGFALYDDGQVIGAAFAHAKTWWTSKQFMIDEFFISGEKQRMGYGKTLLAYCSQFAREQQISSVLLMTNRFMPSFSFYENNEYLTAQQYVFMFKQA